MGTRSLTFVHEDDGPAIVCIYKQYDGYFDGLGNDILTFLKGSSVVNGIGMGDTARMFNGAGDLAARLITAYKGGDADAAGAVYVHAPDTIDVGEEFIYDIYCTVGQEPRLKATAVYSGFVVEGRVSEIVWPTTDDDGNYVAAAAPVDLAGPLTREQRNALFASFTDVFGDAPRVQRHAFTRMVLGTDGAVSWASGGKGELTAGEASKVLDALNVLNV